MQKNSDQKIDLQQGKVNDEFVKGTIITQLKIRKITDDRHYALSPLVLKECSNIARPSGLGPLCFPKMEKHVIVLGEIVSNSIDMSF